MKKTIRIALAVVIASVLLLFVMGAVKYDMTAALTESRVWQHGTVSASADTGPEELPENLMVDSSFESHLPLLVIDTDDVSLPDYAGAEDSNPYVDMTVEVYDSGAVNRLSDAPGAVLTGRIKIRGEGSKDGAKFQYRLKLLNTFGDDLKYSLLGMQKSDEWILDGCASDESCLRNYLAYNLASEAGLNSPDVRYCEVLLKTGDRYEYMGLYLAVEPVEQGKGRVEFKGKRSLVGAYSYIVKRDGESSSRPMLDTWAYLNGFDISIGKEDRRLTLVYPKNAKATEAAIQYVTEDLSRVEQILYSDTVLSDAALNDELDLVSFANYYLINEFTMNRDAGKRSTYMYRDIGGKLTMGPVWGFNDCAGKNETETVTMSGMPMFDRLIQNEHFLSLLDSRWTYLRSGYLSDGEISRIMAETTDFLGSALSRDYCRRLAFSPDAVTPEEAAAKLESRLLEHAAFMDTDLIGG